jgi:hypothetical protein
LSLFSEAQLYTSLLNMTEDKSPPKVSRRDFLKMSGVIGASLVLPEDVQATNEDEQDSPVEKEKKDQWAKAKEKVIKEVFGYDEDTKEYKALPKMKDLESSGYSWQPEQLPEEHLGLLNQKLTEYGADFEVQVGHRALLKVVVERYKKLLTNPLDTIIDPTADEMVALIESFAEITGLPRDLILTLAWRENSLRGNRPSLHGDTDPPGGDGVMNPYVQPPYWAREVQVQETATDNKENMNLASFRDAVLPVPATAIQHDCIANVAFSLAIYTEHLERLMIDEDFEPLRERFLNQEAEALGGKIPALVGVSYLIYHRGVENIKNMLDEVDTLTQKEGADQAWKIHGQYFTRPTRLAANTFATYQPWNNPYYKMGGKGKAEGREFYTNLSKDVREQKEAEDREFAKLLKNIRERREQHPELAELMESSLAGQTNEIQILKCLVNNPDTRKVILEFANEESKTTDMPREKIEKTIKALEITFDFFEKRRNYSDSEWSHLFETLSEINRTAHKKAEEVPVSEARNLSWDQRVLTDVLVGFPTHISHLCLNYFSSQGEGKTPLFPLPALSLLGEIPLKTIKELFVVWERKEEASRIKSPPRPQNTSSLSKILAAFKKKH